MRGRRTAVLLAAALTLATAGTAQAAVKPISGTLLDVPNEPYVRAVDVNELGVVVGNAAPTDYAFYNGVSAQRWIPLGNKYVRQQLQKPSGTTGVSVTGVNRFGEPAGTSGTGADNSAFRAIRWPVTGLKPVYLGAADSKVSAVGDNAWGVANPTNNYIAGTGEIVARNGNRLPVNEFPELPGRIHTVTSVGGPGTGLVTSVDGVGGGTNGSVGVVQGGRLKRLPVRAYVFFGNGFCTSAMRSDGTVAYSGFEPGTGPDGGLIINYRLAIHHGGVPGTEENLPTGDRIGSLGCDTGDTLASDGTVAGSLQSTDSLPQEAALWSGGVMKRLGIPEGYTWSRATAVATGGRAVIVAGTDTSNPTAAFIYRNGASTPLTVPAGWSLVGIIELTDRGLVVGNVKNAAGRVRPIIWRT